MRHLPCWTPSGAGVAVDSLALKWKPVGDVWMSTWTRYCCLISDATLPTWGCSLLPLTLTAVGDGSLSCWSSCDDANWRCLSWFHGFHSCHRYHHCFGWIHTCECCIRDIHHGKKSLQYWRNCCGAHQRPLVDEFVSSSPASNSTTGDDCYCYCYCCCCCCCCGVLYRMFGTCAAW